jgi:hypothetical protein
MGFHCAQPLRNMKLFFLRLNPVLTFSGQDHIVDFVGERHSFRALVSFRYVNMEKKQ